MPGRRTAAGRTPGRRRGTDPRGSRPGGPGWPRRGGRTQQADPDLGHHHPRRQPEEGPVVVDDQDGAEARHRPRAGDHADPLRGPEEPVLGVVGQAQDEIPHEAPQREQDDPARPLDRPRVDHPVEQQQEADARVRQGGGERGGVDEVLERRSRKNALSRWSNSPATPTATEPQPDRQAEPCGRPAASAGALARPGGGRIPPSAIAATSTDGGASEKTTGTHSAGFANALTACAMPMSTARNAMFESANSSTQAERVGPPLIRPRARSRLAPPSPSPLDSPGVPPAAPRPASSSR